MVASPCWGGLAADPGDDDLGEGLAVAALLRPPLLLLAEVDHLGVTPVGHDLALDGGARHGGLAHLGLALTAHEERVEGKLLAHVALEELHAELVALGNAILLAAGLDHRVHRDAPSRKSLGML